MVCSWGVVALAALVPQRAAVSQDWPTTRPERTGYLETSTLDDILAFLAAIKARAGDRVTLGSIGKTTQGRDLQYAVVSRPAVASPAEARRLGRPIVFVQGNIHGGEVEGKEALQMLVRDLLRATGPSVLDSIVLIALPNYNADGNDDFGPQQQRRGAQQGPQLVGTRANALGLNLNRDYMKAESPETRGALALMNAWDPHIFVDLHTSNGSPHGYALTYSPSLHPAGDLANATFGAAYARDSLLPIIRQRMRTRHNFETFDYGNFGPASGAARGAAGGGGGRADAGGAGAARGAGGPPAAAGGGRGRGGGFADTLPVAWRTYEHVPRFGTNYYALRGRVAILSEAYSHDPFERRVKSTYAFTREILSLAAEKSASLRALTERSDANLRAGRLTDVPVRARMTTTPFRGPLLHEVVIATGDTVVHEAGLGRGLRRTGRIKTTEVAIYDRFEATRTVRAPVAYIAPTLPDSALALLRLHGVQVERLSAAWSGAGETFTVDSVVRATTAFEGHHIVRLEGRWAPGTVQAPAGSYVIRTAQPLGVLAVILLEPESDDGLVAWNFLDRQVAVGNAFPVQRARAAVTGATTPVR